MGALVARGQITIVDLHDGVSYTLNINGGVRGIAYAADGSNPDPTTNTATDYTAEVLRNGVKIEPHSYSWTTGGCLSGGGSKATFRPIINTSYVSGNTFVTVKIKETAVSDEMSYTIPVVCTKHADGLDWIGDWNGTVVDIKGNRVVTPKLFAGKNTGTSINPNLTGVAVGLNVLDGNDKTTGIVGYKNNDPRFKLDTEGNFFVGSGWGAIESGSGGGLKYDAEKKQLSISGNVKMTSGSTIGNKSAEELLQDVGDKASIHDMNSAIEQKADSILSTVSNTYTDKNTTKSMQSSINQQANLISQKVSSGDFNTYKTQTASLIATKVTSSGVSSQIQQDSSSIRIGFNKINNSFEITPSSVNLRNTDGKKHMALAYGAMRLYNPDTSAEVGRYAMSAWKGTNNYGLHTALSSGTYYAVSKLSGSEYLARFFINHGGVPGKDEGIHQGTHMFANNWRYKNPRLEWIDGAANGDIEGAGVYHYYGGLSEASQLVVYVEDDDNDNVAFCTKRGTSINTNLNVGRGGIKAWRDLHMNGYGIRGAGTFSASDYLIEDKSTFFSANNLTKSLTQTISKNVEWLGRGEIIKGVCEITLPEGLAFTSYSVFPIALGRNSIYVMQKNDNKFIVEADKDCEFEFIVKFKNDIDFYSTQDLRKERPVIKDGGKKEGTVFSSKVSEDAQTEVK